MTGSNLQIKEKMKDFENNFSGGISTKSKNSKAYFLKQISEDKF